MWPFRGLPDVGPPSGGCRAQAALGLTPSEVGAAWAGGLGVGSPGELEQHVLNVVRGTPARTPSRGLGSAVGVGSGSPAKTNKQ